MLELRLCGGVEVLVDGRALPESLIGGRQGRLALAYLASNRDRSVRREELADLLWADQLPDSWTTSLSAIVSRLRRLFTDAGLDGTSVVVSTGGTYQLVLPAGSLIDLEDLSDAVAEAEEAAASGEIDRAVAAATQAEAVAARGFLADDCDWVDARRDAIRDLRVRASLALSVAHLAAGSARRAVEAARHAVELDGVKEAAYRQLMLSLSAAGERAEALRVWERCRITLVEELGVDPSPETERVYLELLDGPAVTAATALPSGVVTFLLTDIVESSVLWEDDAAAMATALERHDTIVASVVGAHGGALLKSKLEGDATVSVFARATECAAAALALLDAIESEPWPEGAHPRLRMAMHTGEAFERGGDYFGPALNRAARLRSLAGAGEVLLSQAVAELVRDHLPNGVVLRDRGLQTLRGLSRAENVFELSRLVVRETDDRGLASSEDTLSRPPVPAALSGTGPFVGRGHELDQLGALWTRATAGERGAVFVGGEPGVGKSRLAGEIAQRVYADGGLVLYGRCDEDLAAPLQPFIEAVRSLAPALGATRLRAVRGVDELTRMVPELTDMLGEKPGVRADPDTERLALFDALTQLLVATSSDVPLLLVLDDLHWAGKTTLSMLRHLLRGTKGSRLLVVSTYRDTELARSHPLAETLADLRRDTDMHRISLGGLANDDVAAYLAAIGNRDRALGRELAEVTAGNPFFLIEVVRHVEESGGSWQPGSLPEGVREATGRRLSRLSDRANEALAVAAVAGTTFDLALVEQVQGIELVDPIAEAVQAGLVLEEPGSFARFRFAHAIVRQVLLSELVSLKRVRLHRTIAELIEASPSSDPDVRLADLAYHWFECAAAGGADRAVDACRRAADRAMERLAYEEAGDLYGRALQALEWTDAADPDIVASLHLARCDALLTAGDLAGASAAIDALESVAGGSERLAAWYTTYEGLLTVLGEPDRLTEIVQSIAAAAGAMRDVGDLTGEAKARYVHASALERLGQIGDAERALDTALAAARTAGDQRLADTILAEAPPAALWGPSTVTRASGQCLDVVRVLRITSGTSAVEAVALRCQAVLEALRGRMDAARRMIGSARRTVERFGLTLRTLETDHAAGLIELLDGEAVAAEEFLRAAHEGLRARGLGGEAAQAAALLGRALLMQDRVDEADAAALEAEALAGSDLKAAITWRDVRAAVAMRRGEIERARALAHEAVELASATDALLLVADARLTLAMVLRASGDDAAAEAEARRAVEACEAKGATVLAAIARDVMGIATARESIPTSPIAPQSRPSPNFAWPTMMRICDAFNRDDEDALLAAHSPLFRFDDRRPLVGMRTVGNRPEIGGAFARAGGLFDPPELLATRGDRAALARFVLRGSDMEVPFLGISRVDRDGLMTDFVMFAPEAMDDALVALAEMAAGSAFENDATYTTARVHVAFNAGDWDAAVACYADSYTMEDRRPMMGMLSDRDEAMATLQHMFAGNGRYETRETLATRGRSCALQRTTFRVQDPEATVTVLSVSEVDDARRYVRTVIVDPDDIDGAFAQLDRVFREGEGREHAEVLALATSFLDSYTRFDTTAFSEMLAPGFVVRDHRMIRGVPIFDGARATAEVVPTAEVYGRVHARAEHITDLSSSGGLWATVGTGELVDGGEYEIRMLITIHVVGGQIAGVGIYDERDVDAARASLPQRSANENDATRSVVRFHAAYDARDWDALIGTLADDFTQDDRRSLARVTSDHDQSVASVRMIFDGRAQLEYEVLATRGRSLCLTRDTLWLSGFEASGVSLGICQVDESGRQQNLVMFDGDDLDGAIAELDRLARESEITDGNAAWRAVQRLCDAQTRKDWQGLLDVLDPSYVNVNYGRSNRLRLEGDDALGIHRNAFAMENLRDERRLIATRGDRLALTGTRLSFVTGAAGPSEVETVSLVECRENGKIVAITGWNPEELDAAYAALEARHAALSSTSNAAWRAALRLSDAQTRHDWQGVLDVLDPHYVNVNYRRGIRLRLEGDEAIGVHRAAQAMDELRDERTLLATRGERLALTRNTLSFVVGAAGPSEVEVLSLIECGPDGRIVMALGFNPEDLDAAYAALDERHAELRASEGNAASRASVRLSDAITRKDWQDVLDLLDPNYVYTDRRQGNRLRLEGDDALEVHRTAYALDVFREQQTLIATRGPHLALMRHMVSFVVGAAGPSEIESISVVESGADGRIVAITAFNPDELDAAYAALDARAAELHAPAGNAAWRAVERQCAAEIRRDVEALRDLLSPDVVTIEHHRGGLRLSGEDALKNELVLIGLDEFRHASTMLATRGERLVLTREYVVFSDGNAGPSEFVLLHVREIDERGKLARIERFAADDLDAAYAALDGRHAELSAPVGNAAWRAVQRHCGAQNRRDIEAVRNDYSRDFVNIEHYRGDLQLTVEKALEAAFVLMGLDQFTRKSTLLATRGERLVLTREDVLFSDGIAGPAEFVTLAVNEVDEHGKFVRVETFGAEDFDQAYAALDARHAELNASTSNLAWRAAQRKAELDAREARLSSVASNLAWRAALRLIEVQNDRDDQGLREVMDPQCVLDDRRHGVQLRLVGEDAFEGYRSTMFLGHTRHEPTLVATRGEYLALGRDVATTVDRDVGPSETEFLMLIECDAHGRIVHGTGFNVDDLDAAYAALEARHAELCAPAGNLVWRVALRMRAALDCRDFDSFVDMVAPDFVCVDNINHLRQEGPDAFENFRLLFALDECRSDRTLIETRGEYLVLNRSVISFVDADGGQCESWALSLLECDASGNLISNTVFNADDLDRATAALEYRYAELAGLAWFENDAWRAARDIGDAWNRRDWNEFVDTLDAGYVYADLRRGERLLFEGDQALESNRVLFSLDDYRVERELLATRGERLAVTRDRVWFVDGDAGPSEVEALTVTECGADGRVVAMTTISLDDMNTALDVVDARYVELGNPDFAPVRRSFDARDWDAFALGFAPDCTIGDYRTTGWGEIDRERFVDYQRSIVELAPDAHLWIDRTRARGNVAISSGRAFGTQEGGPWEIAFVTVGVAGPDGASRHFESYDLSDLPTALRRFDELTAQGDA